MFKITLTYVYFIKLKQEASSWLLPLEPKQNRTFD